MGGMLGAGVVGAALSARSVNPVSMINYFQRRIKNETNANRIFEKNDLFTRLLFNN